MPLPPFHTCEQKSYAFLRHHSNGRMPEGAINPDGALQSPKQRKLADVLKNSRAACRQRTPWWQPKFH
eukprot:2357179-Alexandrium_andersonii.AAC.1